MAGREAAADVMEELQLPNVDNQGGESTAPVAVGRRRNRVLSVVEMQRRLTNEHLLFDNVVSNGN
jgi:hypothetical protein